MLDRIGTSAYELTGTGALPGWVIVVISAFVLVVCVIAFMRGGVDGVSGAVLGIAMVLLLAFTGWWALDHFARSDLAAERRALDTRALELIARAVAPGSALACLDAVAGESVEEACEKALFANPERTAAAVSYVAAQLSLLAAVTDAASSGANVGRLQAGLRKAIETDRFGIAAHVLAEREGCTPSRCGVFTMLRDARRLRVNLAERRFETLLRGHMASWPSGTTGTAVVGSVPATGASSTASAAIPTKSPNNLYFPSASSIPPVNIMTAEPSSVAQDRPGDQSRGQGMTQPARESPQPKGARSAPNGPLPLAPASQ
jgi:hypothetical protein